MAYVAQVVLLVYIAMFTIGLSTRMVKLPKLFLDTTSIVFVLAYSWFAMPVFSLMLQVQTYSLQY